LKRSSWHTLAIVSLIVAFVVHLDLWWWHDATSVLGLPIGLLFHIALCFASSAIFALLICTAPATLEGAEEEDLS